MAIEFRVEPGLVRIFARSVGDDDPVYTAQQFGQTGDPIVTPPTFVRAVVEHFDDEDELRQAVHGDVIPQGGSSDRFHAEQHFEYLRPFRAGERVMAHTRPGRTWQRQGRTGTLQFTEALTDFLDVEGEVVVRTRRVGVRVHRKRSDERTLAAPRRTWLDPHRDPVEGAEPR
ncbi:MAG: hypothetical protein EOP24_36480 [Hyphomicrobiales bacterium]|nr:MAG: hypothetical protein EOP24_36480 [Hyphomicrobiales bacterium]